MAEHIARVHALSIDRLADRDGPLRGGIICPRREVNRADESRKGNVRFQIALLYGVLEVLDDLSVAWERRCILRKGVIPERHGYVLQVCVQVFVYGCESIQSAVAASAPSPGPPSCPPGCPVALQAVESTLAQTVKTHTPLQQAPSPHSPVGPFLPGSNLSASVRNTGRPSPLHSVCAIPASSS